jgi:ATP adenylyltransferase
VGNEQLWAPWRLPYIQSSKDDSQSDPRSLALLPGADSTCFLCQAVADSDRKDRFVVSRGTRSITLLNRYPYNNGHLLVAPQKHHSRLDQLSHDEHCELAEAVSRMVGLLEATIHPEGFNIGLNLGRVAGAGLPGHLHWHIVPRWSGDTNFMPVLAATHVVPQSLEALWELLAAALRGQK